MYRTSAGGRLVHLLRGVL